MKKRIIFIMNFKKEFKQNVMDYFVDEYLHGRTPNPCIACNRYVKWESLLQRSLSIGADYIATGHYARVAKLPNGRYAIRNSVTAAKDQTYALYNLTQEQLSRTLMPVGDYTKDEIREIAEKIGLPVAHKKDSQEICFVPDNDYAAFIERETGIHAPKGNFVNTKGEILGQHEGITHYTVGQRRGLGLSLREPLYVRAKDAASNTVTLCPESGLYSKTLTASRANLIAVGKLDRPMRLRAKIRYHAAEQPATVEQLAEDKLRIEFDEPQRAITPGQSVVLYDGDYVVGGGVID